MQQDGCMARNYSLVNTASTNIFREKNLRKLDKAIANKIVKKTVEMVIEIY